VLAVPVVIFPGVITLLNTVLMVMDPDPLFGIAYFKLIGISAVLLVGVAADLGWKHLAPDRWRKVGVGDRYAIGLDWSGAAEAREPLVEEGDEWEREAAAPHMRGGLAELLAADTAANVQVHTTIANTAM
jgi:hypothetical protein